MNLILASGSPRRKELLSLYTTDFTICVSDFDESGVTADLKSPLNLRGDFQNHSIGVKQHGT